MQLRAYRVLYQLAFRVCGCTNSFGAAKLSQTKEKEKPDTKDADTANGKPALHAFCMICNEGREVAISMCGAKQKRASELQYLRPEGIMCVVCEEIMRTPCFGCGA
jgi:hypothetical protein